MPEEPPTTSIVGNANATPAVTPPLVPQRRRCDGQACSRVAACSTSCCSTPRWRRGLPRVAGPMGSSPRRWRAYLVLSALRGAGSRAGCASPCHWSCPALLAFSAWRQGGADTGIVMLRQPPGTVPTGMTARAILLAAWTLTRAAFLPTAVRIVAGALAVYGLAATVWGIVAATPHPRPRSWAEPVDATALLAAGRIPRRAGPAARGTPGAGWRRDRRPAAGRAERICC